MAKVPPSRAIWIRLESPLRIGDGRRGDGVDLAATRETHTGWPFIPAPSIKGVLKDTLAPLLDPLSTERAFGKLSQKGGLTIGDGRLAALTARSLAGVVAWVTCPTILARLARDLHGCAVQPWTPAAPLTGDEALCHSDSPLLIDATSLYVEGLSLTRVGDLPAGVERMVKACTVSLANAVDASRRLVVVSDRVFGFLARFSPPATTRVHLDYETKKAIDNRLFSQEAIPADSLFCASVSGAVESKGEDGQPIDVFARLRGEIVQLGSGATVGAGLCELSVE